MLYVAIDPSGSFNEGKGHTGIAHLWDNDWDNVSVTEVSAKDWNSRHEYWTAIMREAVTSFLNGDSGVTPDDITVIIESFVIRANGFTVGKMPETILLIGAIIWELRGLGIENIIIQRPSQAKPRFPDELLPKHVPKLERRDSGFYYLNGKRINDHMRDAVKHLLFYKRYGEKHD